MAIVKWEKDETVAVVTMCNGENRQNPTFTEEMMATFDEIVADVEVKSMVLTSDDPKFWSLGVDLGWMMKKMEAKDMKGISKWLFDNNEVFKFCLMAPIPTIAAITGHAFGNGAMLAGACDYRFMRADRGFLNFPEVNINIQFTPSMIAWMKKAIPYDLFIDMKFSGRKVGAAELEERHVIKKACDNAETTLSEAIAFAKTFNKSRATLTEMKKRTYKDIIDKMENEDSSYLEPLFMFTQD